MAVLVGNETFYGVEEILRCFVDLLETADYQTAPDDQVVCSAGMIGKDYSFVTVRDLRRARDLLNELP